MFDAEGRAGWPARTMSQIFWGFNPRGSMSFTGMSPAAEADAVAVMARPGRFTQRALRDDASRGRDERQTSRSASKPQPLRPQTRPRAGSRRRSAR